MLNYNSKYRLKKKNYQNIGVSQRTLQREIKRGTVYGLLNEYSQSRAEKSIIKIEISTIVEIFKGF